MKTSEILTSSKSSSFFMHKLKISLIASLAAACFLIRDGQMKGENIHILEELNISGGSLDGINMEHHGFVVRGGREMENHFECLWAHKHSK